MLVFPLTVVAILYLLIEDTQYRPRILEVLIGANILMVLPFILNIINKGNYTLHIGIIILLTILLNPALYLSLVYVVDQSDAPEKKLTSNMLLGVAVTLSVLLVAPAVMYMRNFYKFHCTTRSFYP
jgi:hydrogenase-4 membrane subunit HyfE